MVKEILNVFGKKYDSCKAGSRITEYTKTLADHILENCPGKVIKRSFIEMGLSDHLFSNAFCYLFINRLSNL